MRPFHQQLFVPSVLDVMWPFESNPYSGNHIILLDEPNLVQHFFGGLKETSCKRPQKHRIHVDLRGLNPKNIKTEISSDKSKLVVTGREDERLDEENFFAKELRRTFKLPENIDVEKMSSFVARNGQLVIEFPIKQQQQQQQQKQQPEQEDRKKRVNEESNEESESKEKRIKVSIELPQAVDESKIKVTCRDHDVIVEAVVDEPESICDGVSSRLYFYRRNTLPKHADMSAVKCQLENKTLTIEAPTLEKLDTSAKTIPIDVKKQVASVSEQSNDEN